MLLKKLQLCLLTRYAHTQCTMGMSSHKRQAQKQRTPPNPILLSLTEVTSYTCCHLHAASEQSVTAICERQRKQKRLVRTYPCSGNINNMVVGCHVTVRATYRLQDVERQFTWAVQCTWWQLTVLDQCRARDTWINTNRCHKHLYLRTVLYVETSLKVVP